MKLESTLASSPLLVVAAALGLAGLPQRCAGLGTRLRRTAPAEESSDDGGVRPFHFDQRLLVCNGYPSEFPLMLTRNDDEVLADDQNPIAFRECRYIKCEVHAHDRLSMVQKGGDGLRGSFQIGELPTSDAVLLLVPEKKNHAPAMTFQSFAFPLKGDGEDAQVVIANTFEGNNTKPNLEMEDHITGKEQQTVSKRSELLNFDRVYSVEEGNYDISIADYSRGGDREAEERLRNGTKKTVRLQKKQSYVMLRTGDSEGLFPQSLVVFPDEPALVPSGTCLSARLAATTLAVFLAALTGAGSRL